jgi:hypothetical protein
MNRPSSTITAATLAGMAVGLFWLVYNWLALGPPAPEPLVSASATFASAVVGYLTPENVLPLAGPPPKLFQHRPQDDTA